MPTEEQLIEALLAGRPRRQPPVHVGPGDDGCVLDLEPWKDARLVVTTDGLEEGVHFRRDWQHPHDLAHKLLAVNVSDLAALGASPVGYLLDVAWPDTVQLIEARRLGEGLRHAEHRFACPLLGGDTDVTTGPLRLTATLLGRVEEPGPVLRSGAAAGDRLFVTGALGASSAVYTELLEGRVPDEDDEAWADACRRFRRPEPRLELGLRLRGRASALMDLSDGLVTDLRRLARASGLAARVDVAAVPVHPAALKTARPRRHALFGGEDYELLLAGSPTLADDFSDLVEVGVLEEGTPGEVETRAGSAGGGAA